jgi:hypothetical protein
VHPNLIMANFKSATKSRKQGVGRSSFVTTKLIYTISTQHNKIDTTKERRLEKKTCKKKKDEIGAFNVTSPLAIQYWFIQP